MKDVLICTEATVAEQQKHLFSKNSVCLPKDLMLSGEHLIDKLEIHTASTSFELGEKRYFPGSVLVALIPETKDDVRERIRKKLSDLNLGKVGGFTGDDWFLFTPTKKFVTHDFVQNVLAALYEANAMTESDVKFAASGFGIDSPRVSTRPGISSGENVDIDRVRRLSSTLYAVGKVFRDEMRENGLSRTPGGRQCKVVITSNVFLLDFNRPNLL